MDSLVESLNAYVLLIPLLLGLVIPFLTELVTKASAPPQLKSFVAVVLSILAGVIPAVSTVPLESGWAGAPAYFLAILVAWLTSGRLYITGWTRGVTLATQNTGIGDKNSNDKATDPHYTP